MLVYDIGKLPIEYFSEAVFAADSDETFRIDIRGHLMHEISTTKFDSYKLDTKILAKVFGILLVYNAFSYKVENSVCFRTEIACAS